VTQLDFEDTFYADSMGDYIVNDTLVSTQYFLDDLKIAYYNAISGVGEVYAEGIEVSPILMESLTMRKYEEWV
jgi:hypothetical protein